MQLQEEQRSSTFAFDVHLHQLLTKPSEPTFGLQPDRSAAADSLSPSFRSRARS